MKQYTEENRSITAIDGVYKGHEIQRKWTMLNTADDPLVILRMHNGEAYEVNKYVYSEAVGYGCERYEDDGKFVNQGLHGWPLHVRSLKRRSVYVSYIPHYLQVVETIVRSR